MDNSAIMEALRRRAGQLPSGAGIPAPQRPQGSPQPQRPSPMQPAIQKLNQSQPDEAMIIIKALINRLRNLTPKQPATP